MTRTSSTFYTPIMSLSSSSPTTLTFRNLSFLKVPALWRSNSSQSFTMIRTSAWTTWRVCLSGSSAPRARLRRLAQLLPSPRLLRLTLHLWSARLWTVLKSIAYVAPVLWCKWFGCSQTSASSKTPHLNFKTPLTWKNLFQPSLVSAV